MAADQYDDMSGLKKVEAVFKTAKPGERSWDTWEVLEYHVRESACTPYFGSVDVAAATARGADFKKLLGRSCALTLWRGRDHRPRLFKGIAFRVICRETGATSARLHFAPALWALRQGKNSRQFDNRTAPEVIEEVVKEGITRFGRKIRMQLTRPHRQRESLVQYRESDWNFVQRLMQDEGMALYFDQGTEEEKDTETLVVVDCNEAFPEVETMEEPEAARPRGPLGMLAEMTKASVPEVNPVLEPAKLVLVVRKEAKNPKSGRLEAYTHPKRQAIRLRTDAAFDGTATFSCSKPAAVRFYAAKEGGAEFKLDGTENVFRKGLAPKWANGASLDSGVTLYAEAVVASEAMDDIRLELSLAGGAKKCGPKASAAITNVEVFLDICAKRNSPTEEPTPLSLEDKVFVGRDLIVQDKAGQFERAQLIIRPVKPAGFAGELELKAVDGRVNAFLSEHRISKESSVLPFRVATESLPAQGQRLWVEAASFATTAHKSTLVLGLREDQGDIAAVAARRRLYLTFDDGPSPETAELLAILSEEKVQATFFLNLAPLEQRSELQYKIIKRILNEGHSIGNHGYRHIPAANREAYRATTRAAVKDNFIANAEVLRRLFDGHNDIAADFKVARLQGDGRLLPAYVEMITKDLRIPHAAWAIEYAPAETARKLKHLAYAAKGAPGVHASLEDIPARSAVVVLMHDAHWKGHAKSFKELVRALKGSDNAFVPLVPVPEGLEAGAHGAEGVVYP